MTIAIIVDGLATGGAERQAVLAVVLELTRRSEQVELVTYHPRNDFKDIIERNRVKWVAIRAKKR
jgi:hypothetical protein